MNDPTLMPNIFPASHSILSASELMRNVLSNYDVGTPTECKLLSRGLNDTYVVVTEIGKFALRVYRNGWRSDSDVLFELDALQHLGGEGVPVSTPILRKDGRTVGMLKAPEGQRHVVLFTYAQGKEPTYEGESAAESYLYGKVAAQIHAATDSFRSSHRRFPLDFDHLLTIPLQACEPFLAHRPKDWEYVVGLSERLRSLIRDLPVDGLELGFCHGDFHGGNANIAQNRALTVYDFDCCGIGWRAYDVAVFRWGARIRGKDKERWPSFISGYTDQRPLSEMDLRSIPYFVAVRHLWLLGLHTGNSRDFGIGWLNDGYFDRALKFFHEWEEEFLAERSTDNNTAL
jgi:Ser/Thr protein kinase RdoA (MazF antagonist)